LTLSATLYAAYPRVEPFIQDAWLGISYGISFW
jgi:hypothetical protein